MTQPTADQSDGLLLAGDVGGTKTVLGIFSEDQGPGRPLAVKTYPSAAYPGLDAIASEFLASVHLHVQRACFDVAGPVASGRAKLTNLSWKPLQEPALAEALRLRSVRLLNDLEAIALGITQLPSRDLRILHRRKPAPRGTMAVIAPGTRLGEAFLVWTGDRYSAFPSEGGHGDFAPGNQREAELLRGPRVATFPHQHPPAQVRHVRPARLSSGDPLAGCARATATSAGSRSAPAWASPTSTSSWPTPGPPPSPSRLPDGSP